MFCYRCGTSLPDSARFCSSCGIALTSVSSPGQAASPTAYPSPAHTIPATPVQQSSVLLGPSGYPQPAFERLAGAVFLALDQNVQVRPRFFSSG